MAANAAGRRGVTFLRGAFSLSILQTKQFRDGGGGGYRAVNQQMLEEEEEAEEGGLPAQTGVVR